MNSNITNWSQIDSTQPNSYIDYLDTATAQTEIQRYKRLTYDLIAEPGASLLDVGCGTGEDAVALAERVGPEGKVIGLDSSEALIQEARKRANDKNLSLKFLVGDVHNLKLADNSMDGCRADRLFMHIFNRLQALGEMIRVTKAGGRILVREPDWDTLIVDHIHRDLTREILRLHFDQVIRHTASGGELYRIFHHAGLEKIAVADTSTLILTDFSTANRLFGLVDAAAKAQEKLPEQKVQISTWLSDLQQADDEGTFFSAVTGFTVVGCKTI
ncbi:methyltransferase domain-containing protein [Acaryochloris marina NIES-2412]|uniref:methyltransferase domain-containing protein n=1 Tax=Acaryochloris marina TaxID=155978 RepID=UPI00405A2FED